MKQLAENVKGSPKTSAASLVVLALSLAGADADPELAAQIQLFLTDNTQLVAWGLAGAWSMGAGVLGAGALLFARDWGESEAERRLAIVSKPNPEVVAETANPTQGLG